MRCFPIIMAVSVIRAPVKNCVDCAHMSKGRCLLFPNIIDDDFMEKGVKNHVKVNFTPCEVARRYATLCGRKAKRFRPKPISDEELELALLCN